MTQEAIVLLVVGSLSTGLLIFLRKKTVISKFFTKRLRLLLGLVLFVVLLIAIAGLFGALN